MKLEWHVYKNEFNQKKIVKFNVFDHWRFEEDVKKALKKCKTKEEFAEDLKKNLTYYFWSKCEYEVIVTSFPVHIKKDELDRLNQRFKENIAKYGHEPLGTWIRPDVYKKIDIYDQVMLNWNVFLDYVWSHKRSKNGLIK